MNDWLTSDPNCFRSAIELKFFLEQFGPLTGRYHLTLPHTWRQEILNHYAKTGDLEKKRAEIVLQRAAERAALYSREVESWKNEESWAANIARYDDVHPTLLKAAVVPDLPEPTISSRKFVSLHDLNLPPTEEESILATPKEYLRVSQLLLRTRPELVFIDPYMNPLDDRVFDVLNILFQEIAGGKCKKITLYARQRVIEEAGGTCEKIERKLRTIKTQTGLTSSITYILVDDRRSRDRLHGRYLLSLKGGIRFEQGFQRLSRGRKVEIAPIGQAVLDGLIEKYIEGKNDLIFGNKFQL